MKRPRLTLIVAAAAVESAATSSQNPSRSIVRLTVAGTAVNLYCPDSATLAEETASDLVTAHGKLSLPTIVPRDRRTSVRRGTIGPSTLYPLQKLAAALGLVGR